MAARRVRLSRLIPRTSRCFVEGSRARLPAPSPRGTEHASFPALGSSSTKASICTSLTRELGMLPERPSRYTSAAAVHVCRQCWGRTRQCCSVHLPSPTLTVQRTFSRRATNRTWAHCAAQRHRDGGLAQATRQAPAARVYVRWQTAWKCQYAGLEKSLETCRHREFPLARYTARLGLVASPVGDTDARVATPRWLAFFGDGRTLRASRARPSRERCEPARFAVRWLRFSYVRNEEGISRKR